MADGSLIRLYDPGLELGADTSEPVVGVYAGCEIVPCPEKDGQCISLPDNAVTDHEWERTGEMK